MKNLIWAVLLLLPAVAGAQQDELRALGKRWRDYDAAAGKELLRVARSDTDKDRRVTAALEFAQINDSYKPEVFGGLRDEAAALAAEMGREPDLDVRHAGGGLMQAVQQWDRHYSPAARAHARYLEWVDLRDRLEEGGVMLLLIGVLAAGTAWVLFTRGAALVTLIGSSAALSKAFGASARELRAHPAVLALPWAGALAATAAMIAAYVKAVNFAVPAGATSHNAELLAIAVVLSPAVLAVYFLAGSLIYYCVAAYAYGVIASARRRPAGLGECLGAAGRRLGSILILAFVALGALLAIEVLYRRKRDNLSGVTGLLARLSAFLLEVGIQSGAALLLATMMGEDVPLIEALERLRGRVTRRAVATLLASVGAYGIENDVAASLGFLGIALSGPFADLLILFTPRAIQDRLYDIPVFTFAAQSPLILLMALYMALSLAFEATLAAGIYLYGATDKAAGPLAALSKAFS